MYYFVLFEKPFVYFVRKFYKGFTQRTRRVSQRGTKEA